jgi:DNA replication protein DnaC
MLIHPTVEGLGALGVAAMADTLVELQNNPEAADMPHADWLGLLIDREVTARDNRRLARRLSNAKLRQAATIEKRRLPYRSRSRSVALPDPRHGQWIRDCNHLAIVGPTGTGKSWLACALGNKACRDGFSVLYKRASRLFADLAQARDEGRLSRLIAAVERVNLLILDDWGPEPLSAEQRRDLREIVDDRYDKGSLLITSQVPVAQWHDIIADPTLGDAILDRIIHNAHRIELKDDSLRRRTGEKKKA